MKLRKLDRAIASFKSGLNCAQSVLTAYSDEFKIDNNAALAISCGFGAGMGRLQETCGAVTGAFMVIGLNNCREYSDNQDRKERSYTMIQKFTEEFKSIHGTIDCKTLLECDLRTEEGQSTMRNNNLNEMICEKCISDSIKIVEALIRS